MSSYLKAVVGTLAVVFFGGCASVQTAALEKGSEDLSCPKKNLRVTYAGPDTYRTSGCGKEKTYKCEAPKAILRGFTCTDAPAVETLATPQTIATPAPKPSAVPKKAPKKAASPRKKTR